MKSRQVLLLAAATTLAGACASVETLPREPVSEREYITGSSLPRRGPTSGVAVYSSDEAERLRDLQILPMDSPNKQKGP